MILVDYQCIRCGAVSEDDLNKFGEYKLCDECEGTMKRIYGYSHFRVVSYSPEYNGGSDKNLINQPDELCKREQNAKRN